MTTRISALSFFAAFLVALALGSTIGSCCSVAGLEPPLALALLRTRKPAGDFSAAAPAS